MSQRSFLLYWPVFAVAVSTVHLLFFRETAWILDPASSKFIYNVLLLNATHLVFPYALILTVPSFTGLVAAKVRARLRVPGTVLFLGVVGLVYLLIVMDNMQLPSISGAFPGFESILSLFWFWFWLLVPVFHGVRQSGGLCLVYSHQRSVGEPFKRLERRLLNVICISTLAAMFFAKLEWPVIAVLSFGGAVGFCVVLMISIKRQKEFGETDKLLFSSRLILWPMMAYSSVAAWAIAVMHAHEYMILIQKTLDHHDRTARRRFFFVLAILVGLITFYGFYELALAFRGTTVNEILRTPSLLGCVLLLYPLASIGHYFLDGVLYRMRDPDVSRCLQPILLCFHAGESVSDSQNVSPVRLNKQ